MTVVRVLTVASTRELDERTLSARERSQLARTATSNHRRDWLISRRAMRLALGCAGLPTDSGAYRFPSSRVSLSHTDGMAVAAVVLGDPQHVVGVGIDIEYPRSMDERAAPFFLSPAESTVPPDPARLLRLWTVKEALFKADPANAGGMLIDYAVDSCASAAGTARRHHAPHRKFCYRSGSIRGAHLSVGVALEPGSRTARSSIPVQTISYDAVAERIYQILSVPAGTLTPETRISELVADSFQLVEMVIDVQEEFDVVFTRSQLTEVGTVHDLVELLRAESGAVADAE